MATSSEATTKMTLEERRDLLAKLLRQREGRPETDGPSVEQAPHVHSKFSLLSEGASQSGPAFEYDDAAHPFLRYIHPWRGNLYVQLGMDKCFVSGEKCYLQDAEGARYLDFTAQYGALPFGFNPPQIWQALEEVRARREPSFVQPSLMQAAGELAQRLLEIAPAGLRYVTFTNSGAESVEVAIKLARAATGRPGILAAKNAFHGLTLGSLSTTGSAIYQQGFFAPVAGFDHVPFGDLDELRKTLEARPDYYAAFIVEPIQGEGGIVEPPVNYLREAQEICRQAGVLFVVDEVQTGLGRTGQLFACEAEGISPDILALAKALGGGLMPIGACLYAPTAYSRRFDLRHSSTFAGNTLACRAGLAAIDLLMANGESLIRQVAECGEYLRERLETLQRRYSPLIRSIRGRGYFMGVELDFSAIRNTGSLLDYLSHQDTLIHLVVAHLLNVEKVRIAPSISAGPVLRIEPPLIAGKEECDVFTAALGRVLDILQRGDTGRLMAFLIGGYPAAGHANGRPTNEMPPLAIQPPATGDDAGLSRLSSAANAAAPTDTSVDEGRFAFIIHFATDNDYVRLDRHLAVFDRAQLRALRQRGLRFVDPFPVKQVVVQGQHGRRARGEYILVPYTAEDLVTMPREEAVAEVTLAVQIAKQRGAEVVGLGGFTSIVTAGGLAIAGDDLPIVTSGNSYTVVAAKKAVYMACQQRGRSLGDLTVAVVGGAGMIGHALTVLLSEELGRLILIGNPEHPERSLSRLRDVAGQVVHHLWKLHGSGRRFPVATLGARVAALAGNLPASPHPDDFLDLARRIETEHGALAVTTDIDAALPKADVVITATSSYKPLIFAHHLKRNAIVCDVSRPFNVCDDVAAARPDVMLIEGGMVRIPGDADFRFTGTRDKGVTFACTAETVLLAMERHQNSHGLCGTLDLDFIREIEQIGDSHGFQVVLDAPQGQAEL